MLRKNTLDQLKQLKKKLPKNDIGDFSAKISNNKNISNVMKNLSRIETYESFTQKIKENKDNDISDTNRPMFRNLPDQETIDAMELKSKLDVNNTLTVGDKTIKIIARNNGKFTVMDIDKGDVYDISIEDLISKL